MLKIGLTGGIGSGKSTIAKIFQTLGVPVYFADDEAKKLMNTDVVIRKELVRQFGEDSFISGKLNRPYISQLVFNDPAKLSLLNSIVHPRTIAHSEEWFQQQNAPYAIKEAALIFEAHADTYLDKIIGVYAPLNTRIERVKKRDHLSEEKILERIHKQMNEEEKMKRCDFVIDNSGSTLVIPQVLSVHQKILGLH